MKKRNVSRLWVIIAAMAVTSLGTGAMLAQSSSDAAAAGSAQVPLSYGVPQVLQLSQAKVGDSTIIAYVQNSGTIYSMNASEIVYLKQQGVSDAVITTMLNQRQRAAQAVAPTAPPAPAAAATSQPGSPPTSTVVVQPAPTYVQSVPASTVYVIPDTQTYNYNAYYYRPYYYPYYSGYNGWYYPPVSFSFGFGGSYHGGSYHGGWGGYHGSYHGGGGWHH